MSNASHPIALWTPQLNSGQGLRSLIRLANSRHHLSIKSYDELHAWSTNPTTSNDFWLLLFDFLEILSDKKPVCAFLRNDGDKSMYPPPRFFPDIQLNFAENMFANFRSGDILLQICTEGGGNARGVTWDELHLQVQRLASAMIASGVTVGDRVAAIISNRQETVVASLATLSLGAIWSTSSPDMGVDAILGRLIQIRPKLVFCESAVVYNAKKRDLWANHLCWAEELAKTPELQDIVVIPEAGTTTVPRSQYKTISWHHFLSRSTPRKLTFVRLPFDHPAFIVYSSGTTGAPKCIVHSAGGLLMQVKKDSFLHYDIRPGDVVFQYTTTAWIMWAMVLVALSYQGQVVIYDGSPFVPDDMALLRLVSQLRVNHFGTSAKYLSHLKMKNISPRDLVDLSNLRVVTSTGSTLTADVAKWFYASGFPNNVYLNSTCGGTDLACSLITGTPIVPFHAGEITTKSIGMATDIYDADAARSIMSRGSAGELVCTQPFPSQPVCFWGDHDGRRYFESYFAKYGADVWSQGDFMSRNPVTGGFNMHGRSDGVLNPSGVRFGSAEIYNVVERMPMFQDSLCVGQRRPGDMDETVLLFVHMAQGVKFTRPVIYVLKQEIGRRLSQRHVPKYVFEAPEIPYTINGKKIETAVKKIINGQTIEQTGTLANPASLDYFKQFVDLEKCVAAQEATLGMARL